MDPLSSRGRTSSTEWDSKAYDGAGSESISLSEDTGAPQASLANDDALLATPNPAVLSLVEKYATSRPNTTPAQLAADNNASRTMQRDSAEPYAQSGMTQGGDWFAGAAALKTRDPRSGVDAEVFTASAQVGEQNEAQVGLARVGYSGQHGAVRVSVSAEALTARANAGVRNDDGSEGANLGATATGAGVEATIAYGGWLVTAGVSLSAGAAVSSGERNVDGDSVPERCFKASIGPTTLGFCSEL